MGERVLRLRAIAFAIPMAGLLGTGAWLAAEQTTAWVEDRAADRLAAVWQAAGLHWADARPDGLVVRLFGEAPSETARFHAVEIARQVVDLGRIEDRIVVPRGKGPDAPAFTVEILRDGADAALIGLVPAADRAALAGRLAASSPGVVLADMLETADHPAPEGWDAALAYAMSVADGLPHARLRVTPDIVHVAAVATGEEERAALARTLQADAPDGVAVELDLAAPRPVVTPFVVAFRLDAAGAELAECVAETPDDAARIEDAARSAGASDAACSLALGSPSPDWADAAVLGIRAVTEMGEGAFNATDLAALLTGPADMPPDALGPVLDRLSAALPPAFKLATEPGDPPSAGAPGEAGAFHAVRLRDGSVQLGGRLNDVVAQRTVLGMAEAAFGHDAVMNATVLDPSLPGGWMNRVLAGVEALAELTSGELTVTAETLTLTGLSADEDALAQIEAAFLDREVGPARLDVAPDLERIAKEAAEAEEAAAREAPFLCAAAVEAVLAEEMVLFEPGSATIDAGSEDVVEALSDALEGCPGARFRVAGHTDSQGSAALNQSLSESRAQAVVDALAGTEAVLEAAGYGPDRPIADNGTPEGRALNRRIDFVLIEETERAEVPPEDAGAHGPN